MKTCFLFCSLFIFQLNSSFALPIPNGKSISDSIAKTLAAQQHPVEIGLGVGFLFNTIPGTFLLYTQPGINLAGAIKVLYNFKRSQMGASVSSSQLAYYYWLHSTAERFLVANPAVPVTVFWNQQYYRKRSQVYLGLSSGYVKVYNAIDTFENARNKPTNTSGFIAGAQLGFTRFFNFHLGINAEFSYNYMVYNTPKQPGNIWLLPVTFGIRYRLRYWSTKLSLLLPLSVLN